MAEEIWYGVWAPGTDPKTHEPYSTGTVLHDAPGGEKHEEALARLKRDGFTVLELPESPQGKIWDKEQLRHVDPPKPPRSMPRVEFTRQFTPTELMVIVTAYRRDPDVFHFWYHIESSASISLGDEWVQAGIALLVEKDLLTPERAAIIGAV